jgi:hypothetical protein
VTNPAHTQNLLLEGWYEGVIDSQLEALETSAIGILIVSYTSTAIMAEA